MNAEPMRAARVIENPHAAARGEPYGAEREAVLNAAGFAAAQRTICTWPGYAPTPLVALPGLARRLGIGALLYKDERPRFGLKSFKALGGAYAVHRVLERNPATAREDLMVTCATDGNHGRSVAWGAQLFGCKCTIFIHETVSEGRRAAIARYGAEVVRVPGNYDDAVRHAAATAAKNGWTVVSDTAYEGYREIPVDVMHGYGVMADEIGAQLHGHAELPTHVLVQAGVGALAGAICANFWLRWGARRPRCVIVEPSKADCFYRSIEAGTPVCVQGELDTLMAGLACGEVSALGWAILKEGADAVITIDDGWAVAGVRAFARPAADDPALVSGETGAAGLAAMLAINDNPAQRALLRLDAGSRVLLLGSEGDTDPEIYANIVGRSAEQALA
ncbi:MAG: diaminopropionate ammonia-lyase [Betaproteobacteria bacterium]|nr:diaminopropionate ammonia-lyase [Betaproteobacteria bacterium]